MNRSEVEALSEALCDGARYGSGDRIGLYRVIRRISAGGMGEIYHARRDDNLFRHDLAIKLIRPGSLPESALRRFEQERQILAQLDHPNIARLLDGGVTPGGRPYFVMEFIRGKRIDEYALDLTLEQKLALFLDVCKAVQFAHRNLIVHRDLKPSNILVTEQGVVKLLDFGIAKLLRPEFYDFDVAATRAPERVATPEYASPEQLCGDPVSTVSDVYSLGVLLYQLLTRRLPYEFEDESWEEIQRKVCGAQDPAPPSKFAGVPRDVDQIVLKALRKEADERYLGVDLLAEDIRRYRQGYPVAASRGTWIYQARKFATRNRGPVVFGAVLAAVLLASGMSLRSSAERLRVERDTARQTAAYLTDLFQQARPATAGNAQVSARDLLDAGAARLKDLDKQPALQAALADAIGESYRSLSQFRKALPLFEQSVRLNRAVHGAASEETAFALMRLADTERDVEQYDSAEKHARESVAIWDQVKGKGDPESGASVNLLGVIRQIRGDRKEAGALFEQAIQLRRGATQPDAALAMALSNLANLRREEGKFDAAEPLLMECLDLRKKLYGPGHLRVASVLGQLGQIRQGQKKYAEAEMSFREAMALEKAIFVAPHVRLATTKNNYGNLLVELGRADEAIPLFEEALAMERTLRAPDAVPISYVLLNLGGAYEKKGDFARAEPLIRKAVEIRAKHFPVGHPARAKAESRLAKVIAAR